MLVTADNFVQLFFGWEGVGLASYLLIGFWYDRTIGQCRGDQGLHRQPGRRFRLRARHLRGVRDASARSISTTSSARRRAAVGTTINFLGWQVPSLTIACLLLFVGAMGKSAQLGLHTWLPDAMEGPTPVSALIHAATMVTAGVFMVARLSPLFELRADRAGGRRRDRRHHGDLRRHDRHGAERHQAGHRLFDLLAARLHVLRRRRRRPMRRRCSTCSPTPSSRRCCSSAPAR